LRTHLHNVTIKSHLTPDRRTEAMFLVRISNKLIVNYLTRSANIRPST